MSRHDRARLGAGALLVLTIGAVPLLGAPGGDTAPQPIKLGRDEQTRLGVVSEALRAAPAPAGPTSTARVLDPAPLIQLDSELSAASASLAASRSEAERTRKLYAEDRTASARAVETASAQAQADALRVSAAQRRLLLEWGDGIAAMPAKRRAALLNDLAHVRSELVRVEMPDGLPPPVAGAMVRLQSSPDAPALRARILGVLPVADPRLQTRGVLAELSGAQATLAVGQMLSATLPTAASAPGVVLPRAALLRKGSQVWVYVQTAPETFVRREVTGYQPTAAGWFVAEAFAPGDRVVTAGAGALLGVETPPAGGE